MRGEGGSSLATGGQLGGAQAGARVLFRPLPALPLAIAGRVSRPLRRPGGEAAIGLDWQASPALHLAVERRIAVEREGRNAWAAFAAGGVYDRRVAGLRLDAYAQAGVVGLNAYDLFADGALRLGKPVATPAGEVTLGAGVWGAAQPRVAHLDIGPQAALRLPLRDASVSIALDGRVRIAGDARPGTGIALTIGLDF